MSKVLADDEFRKAVQINLRHLLLFWYLFLMQTVSPLLFGLMYCLHQRERLCVCWEWGMCHLEVSLSALSDLILDFIYSEIFMIALVLLLCNLYCLQVLLAPLETTITVIMPPIMMMMMDL